MNKKMFCCFKVQVWKPLIQIHCCTFKSWSYLPVVLELETSPTDFFISFIS